MIEFTVIVENYSDKLVESVNEKISEGWMPIGGVLVAGTAVAIPLHDSTHTEYDYTWSIAMIRTKRDSDEKN